MLRKKQTKKNVIFCHILKALQMILGCLPNLDVKNKVFSGFFSNGNKYQGKSLS